MSKSDGQRIAQHRNGVYTWIHSDHLGSATVMTDKDGNVVRRLAYKPFGEEVVNTGTGEKPPYTYTGKELDSSGLMYYGARYYDPALARFITPDTVEDRGTQGLNRYAYALNNPLKYNDPSGHAATAAYRASTPYNIAPYAGTFDTGSNLADLALGVAGGAWNLGASLLNSVASMALGSAESGYNFVETNYNDLTSHYLGDEGFTGNGFAEDMNAWIFATTSLPVEVAYVKQSLSFWKAYSSNMVVNAGGKVKATLTPSTVVSSEIGVGGGSGPWVPKTVRSGGVVAQTHPGSCGSACAEMLSNGARTQAQVLSEIGEWADPNRVAESLGAEWTSGFFESGTDALTVASRGQMGGVLWAPGTRGGHMVVIEPTRGSFLVRDPLPGVHYSVGSDWIERWVAGGVWKQ